MDGYGCWAIEKAKGWRIGAFELWFLRRLLRVPWTEEIQPVHPKGNQSWVFIGRTDAAAETPILPWCWERLKAGGEGCNRGWDGWMASWTQWTWMWVNSGSWWWTGKPSMLQSMEPQRFRQDWANELNWTRVVIDAGCFYLHKSKWVLNSGLSIGQFMNC